MPDKENVVERLRDEIAAHIEKGQGAVLDMQTAMDAHYKVIRAHLGQERGPGFAHRINSLLLRTSGQFIQIEQKLEALSSSPSFNTGVEEAAKVVDGWAKAACDCHYSVRDDGLIDAFESLAVEIRALSDQSPSNGEQDNG
jgi:hypothetical protein